jgi:phospholipid/cholesterol/gamma-HCH transport system ATP-binding protein
VPAGITERRVVLVLDHATLRGDRLGGSETVTVNMTLQAGELALNHVEPLQQAAVFADACSGLAFLLHGQVLVLNQNWTGLPVDLANALRGRIGRVFAGSAWLPHLSLLDNVVLRQLHQTHHPLATLRDEAVRLAEHFGLPGLPTGLPRDYMPEDLQRAACVRAFLGSPVLMLLDEPTSGVYPELLVPLVHAIRQARSQGSAVVWLTAATAVWSDSSIPATSRYRLVGRQFIEVSHQA